MAGSVKTDSAQHKGHLKHLEAEKAASEKAAKKEEVKKDETPKQTK